MTSGSVPLLAVIYSSSSAATPIQLAMAADGLCDLLLVAVGEVEGDVFELLEEVGEVMATPAAPDHTWVADLLTAKAVAGIVTFGEHDLELTARVAEHAGLRHHSVAAVVATLSKTSQRRLLALAGMDHVRVVQIDDPSARPPASFPFPAVLKPARGTGSSFTFRIETLQVLIEVLEGIDDTAPFPLVLESELCADPERIPAPWGDYVSVEGYVADSVATSVGVTGKVPLEPPFRECGGIFPSADLGGYVDLVRTTAERAVEALGLSWGLTHVELKLTTDKPSVIEVNARLGGYQEGLVLAATGDSLVRAGMEIALGTTPQQRWEPETVAWWTAVLPPLGRVEVHSIHGVDEVRAQADVRVVVPSTPGPRDSNLGWGQFLVLAQGISSTHDRAAEAIEQVRRAVWYS